MFAFARPTRETAKLRKSGTGQMLSNVLRIPAPVGGWNSRDAFEAMKPDEAIRLINWLPGTLGVKTREGYTVHASGMSGNVEAVMEYSPPDAGALKLFAATNTAIFDVTAGGVVGAPAVSSLTDGYWQHTMFSTSAGSFLFIVNGVDDARHYNGSSWVAPTITGVSSADFTNVAAHKFRLWFCEDDTLTAWYLPTSSIAGAATAFPLGGLCRLGGYLMATTTWTRDGGDGVDDLWVAITSRGEVLIYSGTDPSDASTWALIGVFRIPPPIGRKCFIKLGADVGVLTAQGLVSLEGILTTAQSGASSVALTNKINGAFEQAYESASQTPGWQVIEHPTDDFVLVNVPVPDGTRQFVMSSETGAWAEWRDIDARSWSLFGDNLYFGGTNGVVYRYGGDFNDNGNPIYCEMQTSFSFLKKYGKKRFLMVRPLMQSPQGFVPQFLIRTDYDTTQNTVSIGLEWDLATWDVDPWDLFTSSNELNVVAISSGGSAWDEATWDVASWQIPNVPTTLWQSTTGVGSTASIAFAIRTDAEISLQAFDLLYEEGGML
jgi:hypothetical protein